jgi:hypothetical protein
MTLGTPALVEESVHIFVFLHIATVMAAVSLSLGPFLLLRRIGDSGDVPAMRRAFALATPLVRVIPAVFGLGAVLGVVAIFANGFNPFEPWLIIAYVMFALAAVVGARLTDPWFKRITRLAAESPDAAPSLELLNALRDPTMRAVDWFDRIIILAFIFDMVFKPFS